MKEKQLWAIAAGTSAALGGWVLRRGLEEGWKRTRHEDPPENPADADVSWRDALIWAGVAGLTMGLGRVVAQRAAARGWRRLKGKRPPL